MMLVGADPGAAGKPHHHRKSEVAAGAITNSSHMGNDLIEGRIDEAVELDLGDRSGARHRHPDGYSHYAPLVEGGVDHPVGPITPEETFGDPKHSAGGSHVLAEHDDVGIPVHGLIEGGVDRLGHGLIAAGAGGKLVGPGGPDLLGAKASLDFSGGSLHIVELVDDEGGGSGEGGGDCRAAGGLGP